MVRPTVAKRRISTRWYHWSQVSTVEDVEISEQSDVSESESRNKDLKITEQGDFEAFLLQEG